MRAIHFTEDQAAGLTSWRIAAKLFQIVPEECLDSRKTEMG